MRDPPEGIPLRGVPGSGGAMIAGSRRTAPSPARNRTLRVFCFPHAGGSTSIYRPWSRHLPPAVQLHPVELKGRGPRMGEPPHRDMTSLVRSLTDELGSMLEAPFVLLGHSMGGIVAYEVARELRRRRWPAPRALFLMGVEPPHLKRRHTSLHQLPRSEFIEQLAQFNGTPPGILEDRELMELLLPTIRADFEAFETYRYEPGTPLDVPMVVFGGTRDRIVDLKLLPAWERHTRGDCVVEPVPGGHFFPNGQLPRFIARVVPHLERFA